MGEESTTEVGAAGAEVSEVLPPDAAAQVAALERAPVALGLLDARMRYVRVNRMFAAMNGVDAEAHVGRAVREVVPRYAHLIEARLRRVLETGEPVLGIEFLTDHRPHDVSPAGGRFYWCANYFPTRDPRGRVNGIAVAVVENTATRTAELRAATILEEMPDGFLELDAERRVLTANAAALRLLARSRDALVGRRVTEVLPLPALDPAVAGYVREAQAGRPAAFEVWIEPLGRWFDVRLVSGTGGLLVFFRDVSEARAARTATVAERARPAALLDDVRAGVVIAEAPSGRLVEANRAFDRIWRRDFIASDDVAGYAAYPATHLDGRPYAAEEWPIARTIAAGGQPMEGLARIHRPDGTTAVLHTTTAPMRDADGRLVTVLATVEDVTARLAAEAALKQSEARFRFLAETVPEIVWTAEPDGRIDYANRRWTEVTGRELTGTRDAWFEVVHPDDLSAAREASHRAVETGEPMQLEYRVRIASGDYRWMRVRGRPMRDEAGRLVKWFGTNTDIHDYRLAVSALEEAVQAREQFIAVASHELRTPLAALSLHVASLEQQAAGEVGRLKAVLPGRVAGLRRQVQRLVFLVNQLLDVSRITSGLLTIHQTRVDFAALVREVVERLGPVASEEGVTLSVRAPPSLVVRCDPSRMEQVIVNLVSNAIRYGERQPADVILDELDGRARLRVVDRGPGVPEESKRRIFERFARGIGVAHESGFGLGLWIASEIARAHCGELGLESRPGEGSTFILTFPREPADD